VPCSAHHIVQLDAVFEAQGVEFLLGCSQGSANRASAAHTTLGSNARSATGHSLYVRPSAWNRRSLFTPTTGMAAGHQDELHKLARG
jgi:hypothetical protein